MRTPKTIVGALLALSLILAACGGDDDGGSSDIDGLVTVLAETLGIPEEDATCVAQSLLVSLGEDGLLEFRDADREPTEEETAAIIGAIVECDVPIG